MSGKVEFAIGGKSADLLRRRLSTRPDVVEALDHAVVRRVGRNISIRISASPATAASMHEVLAAAADDRTSDSCSRTQYRTAAARADAASGGG